VTADIEVGTPARRYCLPRKGCQPSSSKLAPSRSARPLSLPSATRKRKRSCRPQTASKVGPMCCLPMQPQWRRMRSHPMRRLAEPPGVGVERDDAALARRLVPNAKRRDRSASATTEPKALGRGIAEAGTYDRPPPPLQPAGGQDCGDSSSPLRHPSLSSPPP